MQLKACFAVMVAALFVAPVALKAQAPAGSTGQCKDGTYTSAKSKRGACAGHGGVSNWLAGATPAAPAPASSPAPAAPAPTPRPAPTPASRPAPIPSGNGQVWVNTDSHVYHCAGTKWYGKTKSGKYLSEAQAKAEGDKPAYGKDCSAK